MKKQRRVLTSSSVLVLLALLIIMLGSSDTSVVQAASPNVHVNQVGYYPGAPKRASIVNSSNSPVTWQLKSSSGAVVASGQTTVFGFDAVSGDNVHQADFSAYQTQGTGYTLVVGSEVSHPFDITNDIYKNLKKDAMSYFYHNRSGIAITMPYAGRQDLTRAAGHLPDRAGCNASLTAGFSCDYTLDVTGGWYDAGDHGKYVVNGGIAVWTLMNQYERGKYLGKASFLYNDGTLNIPENTNGVPDILDEARWQMKFMLAMQVPSGKPYAGMAYHKMHDGHWTGIPTAPANDTEARYLHRPSTAATLNLAATAAQCARIWQTIDPTFSAQCLSAAQTAWSAAKANPSVFPVVGDNSGGGEYGDDNVSDDFYWAAAELYITTGGAEYLNYVKASPHFLQLDGDGFTWGGTRGLGTVSLAVVPSSLSATDKTTARNNLMGQANGFLNRIATQGYRVPITKYEWGSNSFVLNNIVVMGLAYDFSQEVKYLNGMSESMDYILGRNPMNQSYVSGYGEQPLMNPHHRFWAKQKSASFPSPAAGAVSGGPNPGLEDPYAQGAGLSGCKPAKCFVDHIESWSTNEITINWNAPLAWVTAYMDEAYSNVTPTPTPTGPTQTPTNTPTATPTAGANLALNKPATASSAESATYSADKAVDGNGTTRWSSAFNNGESLTVDLGGVTSINRVALIWEAAYGSSYDIQVSNDNVTWTTIKSVTNGDGGTDDLTVSGNGRYVRMQGRVRATPYGYSIYEFQIYGGQTLPTNTPTATNTPGGSTPTNTPVVINSYKWPYNQGTNISFNAADVYQAWLDWKAGKITSNNAGGNGRLRVMGGVTDSTSVSEGMAYGILFASIFDDQATLDGLWLFVSDHIDNQGLMHWYIGNPGQLLGSNAATDADEDMVIGLINACVKVNKGAWPASPKGIDYCAKATTLINNIYTYEVNQPGNELLPGDMWGKPGSEYPQGVVNLSYFAPAYYTVFGKFTNQTAKWEAVNQRNYALVNVVQSKAGNCSKLVPNWNNFNGDAQPVSWQPQNYGWWSYDAARFAWRIALDKVWYNTANSVETTNELGSFFSSVGLANLGEHNMAGVKTGSSANPFFTANAGVAVWAASNLTPVNCGAATGSLKITPQQAYDAVLATKENSYYGDAWRLFALTTMTGNFPNLYDMKNGPTPTATNTPVGPTPTNTPVGPTPTNTPVGPTSVPTNTPVPGTHLSNPFAGAKWYINPGYAASVTNSADKQTGTLANQMRLVADIPTFVWLDSIAAVNGTNGYPRSLADHFDVAIAQGANLIGIVVYDLPNRDCSALASGGELLIAQNGFTRYKTEYIDTIASVIASKPAYANLRIVAVIEPDSLPNLVTNVSSFTKCQEAAGVGGYKDGIIYALDKLRAFSNVYAYLDIAHSGWLGWESNLTPAVTLYMDVINATKLKANSVDGFVSNTSGSTPVIEPLMTATQNVGGQPVRSSKFYEWNQFIDEAGFAAAWKAAIIAKGLPAANANMLVDTSRNGWGGTKRPLTASTSTTLDTFVNESRIDRRTHRGNWCNQSGGGLGERPQVNPTVGGGVYQAFVWVKPPGESDGSSSLIPTGPDNPAGKGFDRMCDPTYGGNGLNGNTLTNALPNAPISGRWFETQFIELVQNAYPPLSGTPLPTNTPTPVGPTATSTNTPVGPTATPTVTNTPVGPTPTPFGGPAYLNPNLSASVRANDLLGRMTLQEKVGQMTQVQHTAIQANPSLLSQYFIGSLLSGGGEGPSNGNTSKDWADMYDNYQNFALSTRLKIPMIYGIDAVHGNGNVSGVTIFPHNIGLGATRNPILAEQIGRITALEVSATGVDWTFSPCLCIARDERWGRYYESFGEDPEIASMMSVIVRGYQGNKLSDPGSVLATSKHFVGDGGTTNGQNEAVTELTEAELRTIHIAPYIPSISNYHVGSIMPSYSSVRFTDKGETVGTKMHAHKYLLTTVLKGELGFDGFLISDWAAIDQIPGDYNSDVRTSINAGLDMIMVPTDYAKFTTALLTEINNGNIPMSRIDDAVRRILIKKFELGLFEKPFTDRSLLADVGSAAHRAVARQAVQESLVLLKNDNNVLPLSKSGTILVAGKNADNLGYQMGGWSIEWQGISGSSSGGKSATGTTILQGIRQVAPSANVVFNQNADGTLSGNVGIVVVGETPYAETMGDAPTADKLSLTAADKAVVQKVCAAMPCVVVLISGRPLFINDELAASKAFVAAWLPGSEGQGVADVLFGDAGFKGKLPVTWPKSFDQLPINKGDGKQGLFAYGFGLTYGNATPTPTPTNTPVGPTVTPTNTPVGPTATATPSGNLARNKPATSSSFENTADCANCTASLAVDGNTGTRWSSAFNNSEWITVDLGATTSINRVVLNWEAAYGKAYNIQVSTDNVNWTTMYQETNGNGGIDDLTVSGTGRYVRMQGVTRATAYGYSIYEFEVYGGSVSTPTPIPPTATSTPVPPTATATPIVPTATNTPVPPTGTATSTSVPPTATGIVPPTATATATATSIPPTATATATSVPPTATATPATSTCQVNYVIQTNWGTGFAAAIKVKNTGTSAINGYVLTFDYNNGQTVISGSSYNVGVTSQSGSTVTLDNSGAGLQSWQRDIPAGGESTTFGFNANTTGSNATAINFKVNGSPCGTY